jgi:hypothetical protein
MVSLFEYALVLQNYGMLGIWGGNPKNVQMGLSETHMVGILGRAVFHQFLWYGKE